MPRPCAGLSLFDTKYKGERVVLESIKFFISLVCMVAGSVLLYVLVMDMARAPSTWSGYDYTCAIAGTVLFAGGVTVFWHQRKAR